MDNQNKVLEYANKLEHILCHYLECDYTEFGVKANDNLTRYNWQSPINFALGYRYASSNKDPKVKADIDYFLGNVLEGQSIGDVVENMNTMVMTPQKLHLSILTKPLNS